MDIEITLVTFEEEVLTPDYVNVIKTAVVSFINSLGLGKDIIPSQLYVPIYNSVDGVNVTNIRVKPNGSGSFLQPGSRLILINTRTLLPQT